MTIYRLDLQLFAGEKTEKATLKKRRDARERGQVLKSIEINSAILLLASFGSLKILIPKSIDGFKDVFNRFLTQPITGQEVFTYNELRNMYIGVALAIIRIIGPFLLITLVAGLIANYIQVGFIFTTKTLAPKLSRINPIEGFKRIFSKRGLGEFVKSIMKLAIIGILIYTEIKEGFNNINNWYKLGTAKALTAIGNNAYTIAMKAAIALLIFAIADYGYQWWQFEADLKMTKQEVKDEYKLMEGDPQVKSRIRSKQRELGMRRMMQEIPKADVIITNPTHFAVALRYSPEEDDAPLVIAKGQGLIALRIKEIAKEHKVVVTENKSLAQALFYSTDIGQGIPQELFQAVAEVLAYVYDVKGKTL